MSEADELEQELAALGQLQRERLAERVEDWDRVAGGELELDSVKRARMEAGDEKATVDLGVELFRPFDEDDDAAIAEAVLRELDRPEPANDAGPKRKVTPVVAWLTPILVMAAAAILLIVVWPEPTLPQYTFEHSGSVELVRSDPAPADKIVLGPTTPFTWTLRPKADTGGAMAVRVFAVSQTGAGRELDLGDALERAQTGSVRVSGRGALLGLEPGVWRIVVAIAREEAELPGPAQAAERDSAGEWRRLEFEIELIP